MFGGPRRVIAAATGREVVSDSTVVASLLTSLLLIWVAWTFPRGKLALPAGVHSWVVWAFPHADAGVMPMLVGHRYLLCQIAALHILVLLLLWMATKLGVMDTNLQGIHIGARHTRVHPSVWRLCVGIIGPPLALSALCYSAPYLVGVAALLAKPSVQVLMLLIMVGEIFRRWYPDKRQWYAYLILSFMAVTVWAFLLPPFPRWEAAIAVFLVQASTSCMVLAVYLFAMHNDLSLWCGVHCLCICASMFFASDRLSFTLWHALAARYASSGLGETDSPIFFHYVFGVRFQSAIAALIAFYEISDLRYLRLANHERRVGNLIILLMYLLAVVAMARSLLPEFLASKLGVRQFFGPLTQANSSVSPAEQFSRLLISLVQSDTPNVEAAAQDQDQLSDAVPPLWLAAVHGSLVLLLSLSMLATSLCPITFHSLRNLLSRLFRRMARWPRIAEATGFLFSGIAATSVFAVVFFRSFHDGPGVKEEEGVELHRALMLAIGPAAALLATRPAPPSWLVSLK